MVCCLHQILSMRDKEKGECGGEECVHLGKLSLCGWGQNNDRPQEKDNLVFCIYSPSILTTSRVLHLTRQSALLNDSSCLHLGN